MSGFVVRSLVLLFLAAIAEPACAKVPSFLPSFYDAAIRIDGQPLPLVSEGEDKGVKRAIYSSPDGTAAIVVGQLACDRTTCAALLNGNIQRHNKTLTAAGGKFIKVVPGEYASTWQADGASYREIVLAIPNALIIWTGVTKASRPPLDETFLETIRSLTDRHRYEIAKTLGNVEHGLWAEAGYRYATRLLHDGSTDAALAVLRDVVAWAPFQLDAHLALAEHASDADARRASALVAWENAEDPDLSARAAKLLGRSEPDLASLPPLAHDMHGLQLVLVPLPPCDIRLVQAAGKLYSESLKIPVRIARLPREWRWKAPDRVYRQRDIQKMLQGSSTHTIDFTKWKAKDYTSAINTLAAGKDALARYYLKAFVRDLAKKPGQYDAKAYMTPLIAALTPYFTGDKRTMFVGVTAKNIFAGDSNYVFSFGGAGPNGGASILSYAVMRAAVTGDPDQSRPRLAKRLAKELVPASLKQLGIPRPADPRDPYSYSSGVARLDQKTMTLSEQTRKALDKFRGP